MGNNLKLSIIGTGLDKIDYINKFSYEDSFINAIKEENSFTEKETSKLNSTFETKLNNSFEQINTSIKEDLNNSQKINIDNETFENNKGIDFNKISNSSLWDDEIKKEPSLIKTESAENKNDDSDPEDPTPSPTKPKNKDIFADLFEKNAFDFDINETDNDTNSAVDNHSISEAPNNKFANLFDNYFTNSKQIYSNGEADNNVVPIAKFGNNNKKIDLCDTKNDKLEYLKTKELPSFLKDKRNI